MRHLLRGAKPLCPTWQHEQAPGAARLPTSSPTQLLLLLPADSGSRAPPFPLQISVLVSQAVFNISGERAEWTLAAQNAVGLGRESDPYLWPTT